MSSRKHSLFSAAVFVLVLNAASLSAQIAPTAPVTPSATTEPVVKLDPFSVSADSDVGFVAASSLAGGRIATALKDTPVAYSVVTKEFLDAFNITDLGQAANFTVGGDWWPGDQTDKNYAGGSGDRIRIRGLSQNMKSRNFFQMDYGQADSYNVDRIDYARGANSVLFGPGGAAGTQNVATKQAILTRNITELRVQVGRYNKYRVTADINRPINDKVAVRMNLLLGSKDSWRDRLWEDRHGIHLAATWRLTPRFSIRAEGEYTTVNESHAVQHWNDYLSAWDGQTYYNGQPKTGAGAPTAAEMAKAGVEWANGTFTVRPDYGNVMYQWADTFRTRGANQNNNLSNTGWINTPQGRVPIRTIGFNQEGELPIDSKLSDIGITDAIRWTPAVAGSFFHIPKPTDTLNWDDPSHKYPTFAQRLKDISIHFNYRASENFFVELAADANTAPRLADNFYRRRTRWVRVDISRILPDGRPNPWFMHPYADEAPYWQERQEGFKNLLLQSVYQEESKFGKLQFGLMSGISNRNTRSRSSTNIVPATWLLPDARGWVENGENNEFFSYNRVYLDEPNRAWAAPAEGTNGGSLQTMPRTVIDRTGSRGQITPYWIYDSRRDTNVVDAQREYRFAQIAGNFDLFNNHLVLIGAARRDLTHFEQQRIKTPGWNPPGWMGVTDTLSQDWKLPKAPADYWDLTYFPKDAGGKIIGPEKPADARPRSNADGTRVPQPQYANDRFRDDYNSPDVDKNVNTWTVGAVVNFTRQIGIFGNKSTTFDFSSPQQDIRNLLVPQPTSQSEDAGIRFNLPNNRLAASVAWFHSYQEGAPSGIIGGFIGNYNAIGDLGPVGDFINRNKRDFRAFRENNIVTTTTIDTKGYEVELTANLTPNWRLVFNASTSKAAEVNYGTDAVNFIKEYDPVMRQILADGGILIDPATNQAFINPALNDPTKINLDRANAAVSGWNGLVNNTIPTIFDRNKLEAPQLGDAYGRWMYNLASDYRIRSGPLHGLRVGLAANYRPGHVAGDRSGDTIVSPTNPTAAIDDPNVNASNAIYGSAYWILRASLSYTVNLKESRRFMPKSITFDLNVDNLLNNTDALYGYSTGSQNTSGTVYLPRSGNLSDPSRYGVPGNVFYYDPRDFTLTARMEF